MSDKQDKIFFHIDVNSAFLSWEANYRVNVLGETTDLRDIPSAVGGLEEARHGVVLAKSVPAKKYGIVTGEPLVNARKKCPGLVTVPPNFPVYVEASNALTNLLKDFSPDIYQYSIDESFLDMTGTQRLFGDPVTVAHRIKDLVKTQLGFTVNIGISNNMLLAKIASDFTKPDRVHTLFPDEIPEKMWPLPIRDLFFVGRATEKKLHTLGINTIGQLAKTDKALIHANFKSHGDIIWEFANGDATHLDKITNKPDVDNKGYGNAITVPCDISNADIAKQVLLSLSETVATRIRHDNAYISVVSVSIVDCDFNRSSKQISLNNATNITRTIYDNACILFDELWDHTPIRQLGVHTSKAVKESTYQYSLFDTGSNEKLSKLDAAIDSIRLKFGDNSVLRASFLKDDSAVDHISGGLSKAKQDGAPDK